MTTAAAPDHRADPEFKRALSRARWSVIQTGLITSGLALFGVYVLANRINDVRVMDLYVLRWLPAGAWIVGTVAGSGYGIASWWNGMRVRRGLLMAVLALQFFAYVAAQYVQFESFDPPFVYRDTNEPISFFAYFHYSTLNLAPHGDQDDEADAAQLGTLGYAMRGAEIVLFSLGAMGAAVVLAGQPACPVCRGAMRKRRIATLPRDTAKDALDRLSDLAATGNLPVFRSFLNDLEARQTEPAMTDGVELWAYRCAVCGAGMFSAITVGGQDSAKEQTDRIDVQRALVDPYFTPDGRPVTSPAAATPKRVPRRTLTSRP